MDDTAGALARTTPADRPVVLVVDDNPDSLVICSRALAAAGYRAATAASGAEALGQLAGLRPAVVVLDLVMPGQDGFETARAIRRRAETMPILVFTGLSADVESRARRAGATAFCTKPLDPQRLVAEVRRLCPLG
jgi:CheY-like chemotaxis protein